MTGKNKNEKIYKDNRYDNHFDFFNSVGLDK